MAAIKYNFLKSQTHTLPTHIPDASLALDKSSDGSQFVENTSQDQIRASLGEEKKKLRYLEFHKMKVTLPTISLQIPPYLYPLIPRPTKQT